MPNIRGGLSGEEGFVMRQPNSFLVVSVLLSVACGGRSRLNAAMGGLGGTTSGVGAAAAGGTAGDPNSARGRVEGASIGPLGEGGSATGAGGGPLGENGSIAGAGGAAGAGFATDGSGAGGAAGCGAKIDDMEDGTGHICLGEGRDGVWYAFCSATATQWPALTTPGIAIATSAIPGGRDSSLRAIHTYGETPHVSSWSGIGFDLGFDGTTYRFYDASAYDGISFWARGNRKVEARISTVATTSTQWGGKCTLDTPSQGQGCVPHQRSYALDDEWVQYWLLFEELKSSSANTSEAETAFDRAKITNIQFRVFGVGAFDFWIDDVGFFAGAPACCTPRPAGCEEKSPFPDPALESAVGAPGIACEAVCNRQDFVSGGAGIRDLRGLQCMPDLRSVALGGNLVTELGPVAGLTRLTTLAVSQNQMALLTSSWV